MVYSYLLLLNLEVDHAIGRFVVCVGIQQVDRFAALLTPQSSGFTIVLRNNTPSLLLPVLPLSSSNGVACRLAAAVESSADDAPSQHLLYIPCLYDRKFVCTFCQFLGARTKHHAVGKHTF